MLDILGAGAFLAISAALKLGVFETLSGGPLTTEEIARRIGADERGTTLMLEAVEALGYVKKEERPLRQHSNDSQVARAQFSQLHRRWIQVRSRSLRTLGIFGGIHPSRETIDAHLGVARSGRRQMEGVSTGNDCYGPHGG